MFKDIVFYKSKFTNRLSMQQFWCTDFWPYSILNINRKVILGLKFMFNSLIWMRSHFDIFSQLRARHAFK